MVWSVALAILFEIFLSRTVHNQSENWIARYYQRKIEQTELMNTPTVK